MHGSRTPRTKLVVLYIGTISFTANNNTWRKTWKDIQYWTSNHCRCLKTGVQRSSHPRTRPQEQLYYTSFRLLYHCPWQCSTRTPLPDPEGMSQTHAHDAHKCWDSSNAVVSQPRRVSRHSSYKTTVRYCLHQLPTCTDILLHIPHISPSPSPKKKKESTIHFCFGSKMHQMAIFQRT